MDNQDTGKRSSHDGDNTGNASPGQNQVSPNGESSGWKFTASGESGYEQKSPRSTVLAINWSYAEFMEHKKSFGWYFILIVVAVVIAGAVLLTTRDKISTGVVLLAAILFGIYAGRQPRVLGYKLDDGGLTIADKFYPYDVLKSFAVVDEGEATSIVLFPLKRFMPQIPIYFSKDDEEKIIDVLANRLPMEQHNDAIDNFMRRIRF